MVNIGNLNLSIHGLQTLHVYRPHSSSVQSGLRSKHTGYSQREMLLSLAIALTNSY